MIYLDYILPSIFILKTVYNKFINFKLTRLLKKLSREELLTSQRGNQGGYALAESSSTISIASIIESIEGPIALTECSTNECTCSYESKCSVEVPWQKINKTVKSALEEIKLNEMINSNHENELLTISMNDGGNL